MALRATIEEIRKDQAAGLTLEATARKYLMLSSEVRAVLAGARVVPFKDGEAYLGFPVEIYMSRRFRVIPRTQTVNYHGETFTAYGITRRQAKNRLLKKVGALPIFPPFMPKPVL